MQTTHMDLKTITEYQQQSQLALVELKQTIDNEIYFKPYFEKHFAALEKAVSHFYQAAENQWRHAETHHLTTNAHAIRTLAEYMPTLIHLAQNRTFDSTLDSQQPLHLQAILDQLPNKDKYRKVVSILTLILGLCLVAASLPFTVMGLGGHGVGFGFSLVITSLVLGGVLLAAGTYSRCQTNKVDNLHHQGSRFFHACKEINLFFKDADKERLAQRNSTHSQSLGQLDTADGLSENNVHVINPAHP